MERISIFNYEAFYLDFLEGNLNEADTLVLINFLEENPELKVDMDDSIPVFAEENALLDEFSKLLLKRDDGETVITGENVDYFIIAQSEGLLDEVKTKELSALIAGNGELENDRKFAGLVTFQPDNKIVYGDKAGLKKKTKLFVLWPYAAAIAAASLVLFFWNNIDSTSNSVESRGSKMNASKGSAVKSNNNSSFSDSNNTNTNQNVAATQDNSSNQVLNGVNPPEKKEKELVEKELRINNMKSNPVGPIASINDQKLAPITTRVKNTENQSPKQNYEGDILALSPFTGMHNPIEPLTKFVSKKTKTEVDFQTTQDQESERRGFHLKIGKFEISRNKRR
jgi:hypothetical protein